MPRIASNSFQDFGRNARIDPPRFTVLVDEAQSSHRHVVSDHNAVVDDRIGADEAVRTDVCTANGHPARVEVVGHHPGAQVRVVANATTAGHDGVVTQGHVVANDGLSRAAHAGVDDAIVPHHRSGSKLDIVPDHAPVTNDHPFVDVTKIPNGDVLADLGFRMDDGIRIQSVKNSMRRRM